MPRLPSDQICPDCGGPAGDCDYARIMREDAMVGDAGFWQDETAYSSGGFAEDLAAAEAQKRMLDAG